MNGPVPITASDSLNTVDLGAYYADAHQPARALALYDEAGAVGGIFVRLVETTAKVQALNRREREQEQDDHHFEDGALDAAAPIRAPEDHHGCTTQRGGMPVQEQTDGLLLQYSCSEIAMTALPLQRVLLATTALPAASLAATQMMRMSGLVYAIIPVVP